MLVVGMVLPRCPNYFSPLFIQGPLADFTSIHFGSSKWMFLEIHLQKRSLSIHNFETAFISVIFYQSVVFKISSIPSHFLLSCLSF